MPCVGVVATGSGAVVVRVGTLGGTEFGIVPRVGWILYPDAPITNVVDELVDCAGVGWSERLDGTRDADAVAIMCCNTWRSCAAFAVAVAALAFAAAAEAVAVAAVRRAASTSAFAASNCRWTSGEVAKSSKSPPFPLPFPFLLPLPFLPPPDAIQVQ